MTNLDQIPFGAKDFADNPERRCPCLLLLDTSYSMQGSPIAELNRGLVAFKDELAADALAMKRVELAIVTFGPVQVLCDFQTVDTFQPPELSASGDTPMGTAITQGLEMLRTRKDAYRANGISFYRPWVFLITDGAPTDEWRAAANAVKQGEEAKGLSFFAIGVEGAVGTLSKISPRGPKKLDGLRFRDLFAWLSSSLSGKSRSHIGPDDEFPLPPPDWTKG
jgi:uncharacterized protein YegL